MSQGPRARPAGATKLGGGWGRVNGTVAKLRRRRVTTVTEPFDLPVIQRRLAFFAAPFGNLFELAEVVG